MPLPPSSQTHPHLHADHVRIVMERRRWLKHIFLEILLEINMSVQIRLSRNFRGNMQVPAETVSGNFRGNIMCPCNPPFFSKRTQRHGYILLLV